MTALDWIIVAFTLVVAAYGYLQGFIVGALSLGGFAVGAVLGTRLAPALLSEGSQSPYAPLLGLAGALLAGAVLAMGLEGIGTRLRRRLALPGLGLLDGLLGAALTTTVALGVAWIAGAAALQTPGALELRREVRESRVLRSLNELLPPSGPILNALARFDPLPEFRGPEADVPPPAPGIASDPQVRAAGSRVVRVLGTACGLGVQGSGWMAGGGLVVTNAHVVAGEDDTTIQVAGEGDELDTVPVVFDPRNDLAVLRAEGLASARGLPLAREAGPGRSAAVLGFPEDGPFTARPVRLGRTGTVLSEDAYGRGPLRRSITSFRGDVRSGNSGGPLVDGEGRAVGTVFAATVGGLRPGGYAVPGEVVARALSAARDGEEVGTGGCTG